MGYPTRGNLNESYGAIKPAMQLKLLRELKLEAPIKADTQKATSSSRFRYLLCALVMLGLVLKLYGIATLHIAAIEMISSDVLEHGRTQLRAKYLTLDPLAHENNAAAEGTCPIEALKKPESSQHLSPVNLTLLSLHQKQTLQLELSRLELEVADRVARGELVDWSISQRTTLFTANSLAGLVFVLPLSRLQLVVGSKHLVSLGLATASLKSLLLPLLAGRCSFWVVFAFEILMNGASIGIFSVLYPLAAVWLLPDEAAVFISLRDISMPVATAIANLVVSQLSAHQVHWNWSFYLPGILLAIITFAWLVLGADKPEESRFVGQQELKILQNSIENNRQLSQFEAETSNQLASRCYCLQLDRSECPALKLTRTPNWMAIIKCPSIWALTLSATASHWLTKLTTLWPTYFASIQHLDATSIGYLVGFKGAISVFYGVLFAYLARKASIRRPLDMDLTRFRKLGVALSCLVSCISLMLLTFFDCSLLAAAISVALWPASTGFEMLSTVQMPLDLSSADSGLIASYIYMANMGDTIALPIIGQILSPVADRQAWRLVWLLSMSICVLASLLFALLAKAEPRNYSRVKPSGKCISLDSLSRTDSI